jgi:spore coat polysaccharide biosynthesis protein SpsF (cytidylyltransferase family)
MKFTPIVFVSSLSLIAAAAPLIEVAEGFNVVSRTVEDEIVTRGLYDDVSEFDARAFFGDEEFQRLAARAPFTDSEIQELMVRSSMSTGADVVSKIGKGLSVASVATSAIGGPIGTAVTVAKYAAMALEKIFSAINAAQQADARKRGDFTIGVVDETLKGTPYAVAFYSCGLILVT